MYKFAVIVSLALLSSFFSFGQQKTSAKENTMLFFNHITKDGGLWKAKNEAYKSDDPNAFPFFLLQFIAEDSLSIRGTISGINTQKDTLLFWELWEFYTPDNHQTKFIQRSPYGMYVMANAFYSSSNERQGNLITYYPNGHTSKHKDNHQIISTTQMSSSSSDFNEALQQWENPTELIWNRQVKISNNH